MAAAVPVHDCLLFTSALFPEGQRPAVLFRYAEGRPSQAGSSAADARANGVTLDASSRCRWRLRRRRQGSLPPDRDHLLHRPLSAILALEGLNETVRKGSVDLTGRLSTGLAKCSGLSWTLLPRGIATGITPILRWKDLEAGQAVFFDFDESGPGYLAYDLAVFLWGCVSFEGKLYRILFGTPSLKAIVRYANCHTRILKQCIFSFPFGTSVACGGVRQSCS